MEILFHDKSFPESELTIDIYSFSTSLEKLYYLQQELLKIIHKEKCYVSTKQCKDNACSIMTYLFAEQRKVKKNINRDILRATQIMISKNIEYIDKEEFNARVIYNQAIITNGYIDELSADIVNINNNDLKNISNTEQFKQNKLYLPIRIYESNPKHDISQLGHLKGKGVVSIMDLGDGDAQIVLNKAIPDGQKLYGYHDGKFYEFQCHKDNCWHGYCPHDGIPENIQRQLTDSER